MVESSAALGSLSCRELTTPSPYRRHVTPILLVGPLDVNRDDITVNQMSKIIDDSEAGPREEARVPRTKPELICKKCDIRVASHFLKSSHAAYGGMGKRGCKPCLGEHSRPWKCFDSKRNGDDYTLDYDN